MPLTGELSDLSLAELIEFFCNQRKTGRLKVIYSSGPGYFYLQSGSVVHARIGALRGIEAVYYALTLPNASFTFATVARRGNRSWTIAAVGAVALIVAAIGVPWGWYSHNKAARLANEAKSLATDNAQTLAPPVVFSEPSNGMANEVSNEAANSG